MHVVTHRRLPPPSASHVYELTRHGRELEPIVLALGTWGVRSHGLDETAAVSADSAVLALLTYRTHPGDLTATVQITFADATFAVRVAGGAVEVMRGPVTHPDVELVTDPRAFVSLLGGDVPLAGADAEVLGRADALERLLHSVRIPEAA